jgi:hypothetical protein
MRVSSRYMHPVLCCATNRVINKSEGYNYVIMMMVVMLAIMVMTLKRVIEGEKRDRKHDRR